MTTPRIDWTLHVKDLLTIAGGVLALVIFLVTVGKEADYIRQEQGKIVVRLDRSDVKQQTMAEALARIEGQLDRRRASFP